MKNTIKLLVYILNVGIGIKFISDYWVVGPVFGLTVILWDSDHISQILSRKHILFVAASTLIYALIPFMVIKEYWKFDDGSVSEFFFGTLSVAVILGSILLPVAHHFLLGSKRNTSKLAVIALIITFYLIDFIGSVIDHLKLLLPFNTAYVSLTVWQAVYLTYFFLSKKKVKEVNQGAA